MQIVSLSKGKQDHFIEIEIQSQDKNHYVYFKNSDNIVLSENPESFLACALLPTMKNGKKELKVEGEVSQKFLSSLSVIQDIYTTWDTSLHRVKILDAVPVKKDDLTQKRVGMFFSGGLDSFYTLLKHQDEITDLIFVHGLDIKLEDKILREVTSNKIHKVAEEFNKNVIEIETNIREYIDQYVDWGYLGHGAVLASVGHLLSGSLKRIYIASSDTYAGLSRWGSHPLLDPLWSSDSLAFVHDGCEAGRIKKAALVGKSDIALQNLRVCWKNPESAYNCAKCEKCVRTMINLKLNNVLDKCTTFNEKLDSRLVSEMILENDWKIKDEFTQENIEALKKSKNDELDKEILKILTTPAWKIKIKKTLLKYKRSIMKRLPWK